MKTYRVYLGGGKSPRPRFMFQLKPVSWETADHLVDELNRLADKALGKVFFLKEI